MRVRNCCRVLSSEIRNRWVVWHVRLLVHSHGEQVNKIQNMDYLNNEIEEFADSQAGCCAGCAYFLPKI